MGTIDDITLLRPSWGFSLSDFLGLKAGHGSVYYWEGFLRRTRSWRYSLAARKGRNYRFQQQNTFTLGIGIERKQRDHNKAKAFLHRVWAGDGNKGKNIIWLDRPLGDGICLLCGNEDIFLLEHDHPLGWKYDDQLIISVCPNCHRLKTRKFFWRLERRLLKWLGDENDSNYSRGKALPKTKR